MAQLLGSVVMPNRVYSIGESLRPVDAESTNEYTAVGVIYMTKQRTPLDKMADASFQLKAFKAMTKRKAR